MKKVPTRYRVSPKIPPLRMSYFVTIRLKDALPNDIIRELEAEFEAEKADIQQKYPQNPEAHIQAAIKRFFIKYDHKLDHHPRGNRILQHPDVCRIVKDQLYDMDGKYFELQAHCVMPNHLHFLVDLFHHLDDEDFDRDQPEKSKPYLNNALEKLKGRAAYYSNQVLGRRANFWQSGSYIHHIKDDAEWCNVVNYIMLNPVRAGLAKKSSEYDHCYFKYQ